MTSEERHEAIRRLTQLRGTSAPTYQDVANNLMDRFDANARGLIDTLIELLWRDVDSTDVFDLVEHGLMQMPKDADGKYIFPGDTVWDIDGDEWTVDYIEVGNVIPSLAIRCTNREDYFIRGFGAGELTHQPPVTVESVLEKFACDMIGIDYGEIDALIAEYAEKLRLRSEDD